MRSRNRLRAAEAASSSVDDQNIESLMETVNDELSRVRALSRRTVELQRRLAAASSRAPAAMPPAIRGVLPQRPAPLPALLSRRAGGDPSQLRADLVGLRRTAGANTARIDAAMRQNAAAIDELGRAQQRLASQIDAMQANESMAMLQRLAGNLAMLERRVVKVAQAQTTAIVARDQGLRRAIVKQNRAMRLQSRTARIAKLNATAASMQSSAYGTKGSPLATNNLLLAANQLLWNFGGDVLRAMGMRIPAGGTALAWLSPVASLLTGGVLLGNRQHERFVSGVATGFVHLTEDPDSSGSGSFYIAAVHSVPIAKAALTSHAWFVRVPLQSSIAPALWPSFRERTDVPVTATFVGADLDPRASVTATLERGVLYLVISGRGVGPDSQVAWLVDTGE